MTIGRTDKALKVENWTNYTLAYAASLFPTESYTQLRRRIKVELDQKNFTVNATNLHRQSLNDTVGSGVGSVQVQNRAVINGVAWVIASIDDYYYTPSSCGTPESNMNNYKIEAGKPVCFDMVTGRAVTGVHPCWGADEYKIIGRAMQSLNGPIQKAIPVNLKTEEAPSPSSEKAYWSAYKSSDTAVGDSDTVITFQGSYAVQNAGNLTYDLSNHYLEIDQPGIFVVKLRLRINNYPTGSNTWSAFLGSRVWVEADTGSGWTEVQYSGCRPTPTISSALTGDYFDCEANVEFPMNITETTKIRVVAVNVDTYGYGEEMNFIGTSNSDWDTHQRSMWIVEEK